MNKGPSKSVKPYLDKFEIPLLGEIPYDPQMVNADLEGLAPIDYGGESVNAIENIKDQVLKMIKHSK